MKIDDDLAMVQTITLMRIYDVLFLLLKHADEEDWEKLMIMHQSGEFAGPDPAYVGVKDDTTN